jgi:hypothetical protein
LESVSGPGSTLNGTQNLRNELPKVLLNFQIHSLVDIPCGDFNWMKEIDLTDVDYQGFDIVTDLILDNRKKYGKKNIRFDQLDLIKNSIPKADLIICRDCLFHYSNKLIFRALENIKRSQSTFILTTTFVNVLKNEDIDSVGLFRPINLQLPPFNFPLPVLTINEESGKSLGKVMGLWRNETILLK